MSENGSIVYIALGSNVGYRLAHLNAAVQALKAGPMEVLEVSDWYETPPMGMEMGARPFLNGALMLRTEQSPEAVLDLLQEIEEQRGRERPGRDETQEEVEEEQEEQQEEETEETETFFLPRTLDLDLLLWEDLTLDTPRLTLPHPHLHERPFVLVPLAQIAPDVVHPGLQRTIRQLRDACPGTKSCVRYQG